MHILPLTDEDVAAGHVGAWRQRHPDDAHGLRLGPGSRNALGVHRTRAQLELAGRHGRERVVLARAAAQLSSLLAAIRCPQAKLVVIGAGDLAHADATDRDWIAR